MNREIYTVSAKHVVISEQNPQGVYQNVTGFPKDFDSRSYGASEENPNGNGETALIVAQAEFADQVKTLTLANNANRKMWTVTLDRADGQRIAKRSWGAFPDMTPIPPEPEPEEPQE